MTRGREASDNRVNGDGEKTLFIIDLMACNFDVYSLRL